MGGEGTLKMAMMSEGLAYSAGMSRQRTVNDSDWLRIRTCRATKRYVTQFTSATQAPSPPLPHCFSKETRCYACLPARPPACLPLCLIACLSVCPSACMHACQVQVEECGRSCGVPFRVSYSC